MSPRWRKPVRILLFSLLQVACAVMAYAAFLYLRSSALPKDEATKAELRAIVFGFPSVVTAIIAWFLGHQAGLTHRTLSLSLIVFLFTLVACFARLILPQ